MNKQNNTPTPTEEPKEYYSFENVNITIEELHELVNALQDNTATPEQLEKLFNQSENVNSSLNFKRL